MKFIKCLSICLLFLISAKAQDFVHKNISFEKKEDYKKYENDVKEIASYILSTPISDKSEANQRAFAVLLKWMTGTPDYHFELDGTVTKLSKDNEMILKPYFAALTSYALNNPNKEEDKATAKLNSFILFVQYCENPSKDVKMTKEVRRAIDANKKGQLKKYLNI